MGDDKSIFPMIPVMYNILLADDDIDDRYFFDKALKALHLQIRLTTVNNGEELMTYLSENSKHLPDVLFLDLNMPRKNGSECLSEIKHNQKLKRLPVIIHSTSMHDDLADELYNKGALNYLQKTNVTELQKNLHDVLTLIMPTTFIAALYARWIIILEKYLIKLVS